MRRFYFLSFFLITVFFFSSLTFLKSEEPKFTGHKLRIAVLNIEPKAAGSDWRVGKGLSEMLTTALVNTGRYIVVERNELDKVLGEQNLATQGRVSPETSTRMGKLLGAQVLISGAITEFTRFSSGGGLLIGPIVLGGKSAKMTIDLRLIDSTTGQIIFAETATGTSSAAGIGGGGRIGDVTVGGIFASNDPMGKAAREALEKIVELVIQKTEPLPWQGSIVKRDAKVVYLNAGSNGNIKVGDEFNVYSKGEPLIDPETGLYLGSEEKLIGRIKITEVRDKYSIGEIRQEYQETGGLIKRADLVRDK